MNNRKKVALNKCSFHYNRLYFKKKCNKIISYAE